MNEQYKGPRSLADIPPGEDRAVARLLDLAGPRPPVPAAVAAQVKAAAHAEWRRTVATNRQRNRFRRGALLALAAMLLLLLGGGLWRWWLLPSGLPVATVERVAGGVTFFVDGGAGTVAQGGVELVAGTLIETAAAAQTVAHTALRLAAGGSLRLAAGSRLRLLSATEFELERGAVYLDSAVAGAAFEVRTALGTARDIGTQFEVRLMASTRSLRIRVREGRVELELADDRHTAAAGEQLAVLADGSVVRGSVPTFGPTWNWVVVAGPGYEIEGRSLAEVLAWVAREGGWQLHYADQALAELAAEIQIYGPPVGENLQEAVISALTGSGLSYQLEAGRLSVSELPAETEGR